MKFFNTHIGFMAFSTYFRIGSQLLVFLLLARILGAEQFGQFSFWLSAATLVTIPINYGFGIQLLREAAKAPEQLPSILGQMLSVKLILTALVILGCFLYSLTAAEKTTLFWLLLLVAIAESYIDFYNFALRSQGHYCHEARLALVTSVLQLPLLVVTALLAPKPVFVAAAYVVSRVSALLLTLRAVRLNSPASGKTARFSYAMLRSTLRSGFPYAADMGVTTLNSVVDIILLKQMTDLRTVGIYQAGLRIMMGANTPTTVVSNVYLPRVSALERHSPEYRGAMMDLNMKMVAVGGGISLVLALFSKFIATTLFGTEYQDLAVLLPWFALVLVLRYVAACFGINLTASGHQSVRVVANLIYSVVFISAALVLVPMYQATGLLMSSVCAILLLSCIYYAYVLINRLPSGFNAKNSTVFGTIILIITLIVLRDAQ